MNCRRDPGEKPHTSPFQVLSDVLLDRVLYYIIWACRAGSKTFLYGGLDTWYKSCVNSRLETKILGGSEGQSQLSYEAISTFWKLTDLEKEFLTHPMLKQSAEWKNGSKVSILTASSKSVRGPHPQILKLDEVDEIDETVYNDALSQPQEKYGYPSSLGQFSTNHQIDGQMDRAIAQAELAGTPVYRYCVWEVLESCRDYSCSTCKIAPICPGIHMKEADGYYKVADFIMKLQTLSQSAIDRDWLCIKRGLGDTVYEEEYDEDVTLVNRSLNLTEPVGLSLDWGGTDPFSAGVWQKIGSNAWVRVTEVYLPSVGQSATNPNFMRLCREKPWWGQIKWIVYDNSRPDLINEWKKAFAGKTVKFIPADRTDIDAGIECVKNAMKPVLGAPALFVNRSCANWRREITKYKINQKTGQIIDKENHCMDETRYWIQKMVKASEQGFFSIISTDVSPE